MARLFNGGNPGSDGLSTAMRTWPAAAFTCSAVLDWTGATGTVMATHHVGVGSYHQFLVLSGGTLLCRMSEVYDITYIQRTSNASAVPTGLTQVAMTWDGGTTATSIKGYVNGTQVDTTSSTTGTFAAASTSFVDLQIGYQHTGGGVFNDTFNGNLAEIALWSVALDAGELIALGKYFSPSLVRPQSLIAYYPLIGRASPEPDLTGKTGDATVTNAAAIAHPRIFMPRPKRIRQVFVAPPTPATLFAQACM